MRMANKLMNGSHVKSTKSELEITDEGIKTISKIVGSAEVAKAKRSGAAAKAAREQSFQLSREQIISQSML